MPQKLSPARLLEAAAGRLSDLAAAGRLQGIDGTADAKARRPLFQLLLLLSSSLALLMGALSIVGHHAHSMAPSMASASQQAWLTTARPAPFLFIGVLSGGEPHLRERRDAVRETWAGGALRLPEVELRFVLCRAELTLELLAEQALHGDLAFAPCGEEGVGYRQLLHKTLHVMEYAVDRHPGVRFILKTDDDSFVNVPALLAVLRALCLNPGCAQERLYLGGMKENSEVFLKKGHKWENRAYLRHTGLDRYPRYASGGGYVLSGDVATSLVAMHRSTPLKFTSAEDVTLAVWILPFDLRHVNASSRMEAWTKQCCYPRNGFSPPPAPPPAAAESAGPPAGSLPADAAGFAEEASSAPADASSSSAGSGGAGGSEAAGSAGPAAIEEAASSEGAASRAAGSMPADSGGARLSALEGNDSEAALPAPTGKRRRPRRSPAHQAAPEESSKPALEESSHAAVEVDGASSAAGTAADAAAAEGTAAADRPDQPDANLSSKAEAGAAVPLPDDLVLRPGIEEQLCGPDSWLVIHKVTLPACMRYIGQRVAACPPLDVQLDGAGSSQPAAGFV